MWPYFCVGLAPSPGRYNHLGTAMRSIVAIMCLLVPILQDDAAQLVEKLKPDPVEEPEEALRFWRACWKGARGK